MHVGRPMISNLPRGLSRRVVEAVTNRLLRAMSGAGDATRAPAAPEAAEAPDTPVAPGAVDTAERGTSRERSRSPKISAEDRFLV